MKITNTTPFVSGWTVGFRPDGREVAVVAIKATFNLVEEDGACPVLSHEQRPLLEADVFGADPALDAPVYENDFAHFKPECDLLIKAQAYCPGNRPAERVTVAATVGPCRKVFSVVGTRRWFRGIGGVRSSRPEPFVSKPISYDTAFGGTDIDPDDESRIATFVENPSGTGYCRFAKNLEGLELPSTEEVSSVVSDPAGTYRPMSFGPLGRNWTPRYRYAGTYDDRWQRERLPFLPDDFDYMYFQSAPADQRIPYPEGGEPIVLSNLTPDGRVDSSIPSETVWVTILRGPGRDLETQAHLDTLLIEPDENRLSVTWRVCAALDRDPFEIREIVVERGVDRRPAKSRARMTGKTYYPTLGDVAQRNRMRVR